jgi:hypothetical protein
VNVELYNLALELSKFANSDECKDCLPIDAQVLFGTMKSEFNESRSLERCMVNSLHFASRQWWYTLDHAYAHVRDFMVKRKDVIAEIRLCGDLKCQL